MFCFIKAKKRLFFNQNIFNIIIRVLFGIFLIEAFIHLTIIFSIHENEILIKKISKWTVSMAILIKGGLFGVKYIVFYGLPSIFHEIVGIKATLLPRCTSLISTNGEMWKYFDTGMYEFIKK